MNSTFFDGATPTTFLDGVRHRLATARPVEAAEDLFGALHWTDVTICLDARPLMEDLPDLADRFRGALGRALERLEGGEEAWNLLFGPQLASQEGAVVRPYLIRAHRTGPEIQCVVRLFGFADCWTSEIEAALVDAAEVGIALKMNGKQRLSLHPQEVRRRSLYWPPPTGTYRQFSVRLLTPLILRHGAHVSGTLDSLPVAIARRLLGIARWCDVSVEMNLRSKLQATAWHIEDLDVVPTGWRRHSSTHPDGQAHTGYVGVMRLADVTDIGWLMIQSAEVFHAGGGATSGYGQIMVNR